MREPSTASQPLKRQQEEKPLPPTSALALELVQGWPWFDDVPAEAHAWLVARAGIRRYEKGQIVYVEGQPVTHIFGVGSGSFRIFISTSKGDEITMEEVVPGGWFPHYLPGASPIYAGNCICQEGATVITLPQPVIAEFGRQWPIYYLGLYREFGSRWASFLRGRVELLSLHNLNVRLAVYVLRMLRLRGKPEANGAILLEPFGSQSEIGARVGGTRQRVNGILKTWTRRGWIESCNNGIRILDVEKLDAEARKSGFDVDAYIASWQGGWEGKTSASKR
ncbi:Crp/Fnr family transcriptional regulator [Polycyclovorans algicola]|uniref:Crp/Fnr family transcriptional regulator n=1 Tax=Polycyclovorans algicola TaxID=616992 RepID=UPI0004A6F6AC|nr:Crp/Fnr family transcriptional regulator [Polycyclovorans algicola]